MMRFSPWNLLKSFSWAVKGIHYALTRERNLRIHFTAGAFVLYFSRYYELSKAEMGLVVICIGFVLACEMINTAIERTVDMGMMEFNRLAKAAKDVAAGAVLVSAMTSVAVGLTLFWSPDIIRVIITDIAAMPLTWCFVLLASAAWIMLPQKDK